MPFLGSLGWTKPIWQLVDNPSARDEPRTMREVTARRMLVKKGVPSMQHLPAIPPYSAVLHGSGLHAPFAKIDQ